MQDADLLEAGGGLYPSGHKYAGLSSSLQKKLQVIEEQKQAAVAAMLGLPPSSIINLKKP